MLYTAQITEVGMRLATNYINGLKTKFIFGGVGSWHAAALNDVQR